MELCRWWSGVLGACLVFVGCQKRNSVPPPPKATNVVPTASSNFTRHLPHAQPKLRTLKLWLGPHELIAELALNEVEVATGMMFRTNMLENEAMLFVFAVPHGAAFYMKNTLVPLSVAYLDRQGTILEVHDLKPLDETPVEAQSDDIQYVLETPQGWFERHKVGTGTVVHTELGSLPEKFFRRRGP
jgi:hypothetical protein